VLNSLITRLDFIPQGLFQVPPIGKIYSFSSLFTRLDFILQGFFQVPPLQKYIHFGKI